MASSLRAKRILVDIKELPWKERILVVTQNILLSVFAWFIAFLTVASLISACVLVPLIMYKVFISEYDVVVRLCVVLVTMVLVNVVIEPPQRKV